MSFQHKQVMAMPLNNEAYSLPAQLLQHSLENTQLYNKQLQPLDAELEPSLFAQFIPKLGSDKLVNFYMLMPERALKEFAASEWDVLPRQKVASNNANLGNWQLSSSVSKSLSFYAWCCNRATQLGAEAAWLVTMQLDVEAFSAAVRASSFRGVTIDHRGSDCQLVFWGKLHEGQ